MALKTRSSSAMIWMLGAALAGTEPTESLCQSPAAWMEQNNGQIKIAFSDSDIPELSSDEIPNIGRALYPRVTAYAYGRLKLSSDNAACAFLVNRLAEWTLMEDITQISCHQSIYNTLRDCLVRCGKIKISDKKQIVEIYRLDVLHVVARILVILLDQHRINQFVMQIDDVAQNLLNILQALLDSEYVDHVRPLVLRATSELANNSGLFPTTLLLEGVKDGEGALVGRNFGNIWKGVFLNQPVAIKFMRKLDRSADVKRTIAMFAGEAVLWRKFHHPNILPFYGVHLWHQGPDFPVICLVSPWMHQGNIAEYLKKRPDVDRLPLILDIANGLKYLHEFDPHVSHGDLKGANILITSSGNACLAAFGLCAINQEPIIQYTPGSSEELRSSAKRTNSDGSHKSLASDICDFGIVIYEIYTRHTQYHDLNDPMTTLENARTPDKPHTISISLWKLVEKCLETDPERRPTICAIVDTLSGQVISSKSPFDWDLNVKACLKSPLLDAEDLYAELATDLVELPTALVPDGNRIEIETGDVVIAVMGPSGTGKSSFINRVMGHPVTAVDDGFESCTQDVRAFGCKHPDGSDRNIVLVDTPGFDDTNKTDYEVLEEIARWLEQTYRKDITLSGVLQFHSIRESRMRGTPRRNLDIFRLLCGDNALKNVILLTTFWDQVSGDVGSAREAQLKDVFWETLTRHGSRVARFDPPTYECAWDLIDQFQTGVRITEPKPPLQLQIELVDNGKKLHETSAFGYLLQFWTRIVDSIWGKRQEKTPTAEVKRALKQKANLEKGASGNPENSGSVDANRRRWYRWGATKDGERRGAS